MKPEPSPQGPLDFLVPWVNKSRYLNPQSGFSVSYRESFPSNVEARQRLTRSPKPPRVSAPPSFHVTLLCLLLSRQPGLLLFTEPTSLFLLWCVLSICMLLPQLFNINVSSTFHPHFDPPHLLAQATFYPCTNLSEASAVSATP